MNKYYVVGECTLVWIVEAESADNAIEKVRKLPVDIDTLMVDEYRIDWDATQEYNDTEIIE